MTTEKGFHRELPSARIQVVPKIVICAAVSESQFPSDSVTFLALYVSLYKLVFKIMAAD